MPNQPNQTYQTIPTEPNLPNQTYHTKYLKKQDIKSTKIKLKIGKSNPY